MTTANKAILAAIFTGLTSILTDLRGADDNLTFQDWVVTVLAALVAGIGVYLVPNYVRGGARREVGHSNDALGIAIIGLIAVIAGAWADLVWLVVIGGAAIAAAVPLAFLRR